MNFKQVLFNLLGSASVAYGGAYTGGATPKQGALVAAAAVLANLVGLFQKSPSAK